MIKISGGELRGRNLQTPPGLATRPTAAKVRQAIFNILAGRVAGARTADLFAGSGALGLEALSRGAAACVFVENRRDAIQALRRNLTVLGLADRARVIARDALAAGGGWAGAGSLDLILADPPYGQGLVAALIRLCAAQGWLSPEGVLVIEHAPGERPPEDAGLRLIDRRAYGQTEVSFLTPGPAPHPASAEKGLPA
ncbi:MAG: 16S rRNA (guanine(966)-N(2))-methyltransferase RsmD [Desulfarculus sp.]|nr:16S rRNA (guanine(966)-N(2))-methyltransferase RsmD [Desulfarculus sp.]